MKNRKTLVEYLRSLTLPQKAMVVFYASRQTNSMLRF